MFRLIEESIRDGRYVIRRLLASDPENDIDVSVEAVLTISAERVSKITGRVIECRTDRWPAQYAPRQG